MSFLSKFTNINGYFTIPIISLIGFLLNMLCFVVFMSSKFKLKSKLKYLITKVIVDMIFCSFGMGFQNDLCIENCRTNNTLSFQIFKLYIFRFLGDSLYVCSGFIEICLTYDRYLILINKKNWLNKEVNFKYIIITCFSVSTCIFMPDLFSRRIVNIRLNLSTEYHIELTSFGRISVDSNFLMIKLVCVNAVQILSLFVLSIMLTIEFRKFIKNKANLSNRMFYFNQNLVLLFQNNYENKRKKVEINFIRMTLTLSVLNSLMRSIDLVTVLFNKIHIIYWVIGSTAMLYLNNICILSNYFVHSLNFFVLIYYYKRFRKAFRNLCSKDFL